ncbi:hypothetical protein [Mangrovibacterium lignilyticum]|uniref:hypothetical protein n=1 Tax=Mangrovibacterium lignilyticum TaxID=2668052 RepID=UPI0013D85A12|nr:hypothetical protein [Mangrovibacterium lignilyticum]
MDQYIQIQKDLFSKIKLILSPNESLVHTLSEILDLSYDSTYRRIRGEKFLGIDELIKLSNHFGLSIDNICCPDSNFITFDHHAMDHENFRFKDWVSMILTDLTRIKEAPTKHILYSAKDPPIYHYFVLPEIVAFKEFLWEKSVFQFPEYVDMRFSFDNTDSETLDMGKLLCKVATLIPSTEIWNENTLILTLRQIEYYWVAGLFKNKDDALNILDKAEKWILHLRNQAQLGFKYLIDGPAEGLENSYTLYETELIHNDNLIVVSVANKKITYLAINSLNLLRTTSQKYSTNAEEFLNNLIQRSNLISHSGEKERNRFFNKHLYLLEELRKRISY